MSYVTASPILSPSLPKLIEDLYVNMIFCFCGPTCFEVRTGGNPAAAVIIYFLIVAAG